MISLSAVAWLILYLVVAALIFGILWWILEEAAKVVGPRAEPFLKIGKILLLILAGFVAIGILLQLLGGQKIFAP